MNLKNNIFLIILFSLISLSVGAQNNMIIKSGHENNFERNEQLRKILGSDNEGFYVLNSSSGIGMMEKFIVQKFDNSTLTKIWSKDFSLNVSSEPFEGAYFVSGKVIILYSTWEKSDKTKTINIKTISSSGEVTNSPTKDARINISMMEFAKRKFFFSFSPDGSKLLVVNKMQDKKKPEEVSAILLDMIGYKKMWEKSIQNMYNGNQLISYNYRVDDNGNLFYLASYQNSEVPRNIFCTIESKGNIPKCTELNANLNQISNSFLFARLKTLNLGDYGIQLIENANEISYEFSGTDKVVVVGLLKDIQQNKSGIFINTIQKSDFKSISMKVNYFDSKMESCIKAIGKVKNPFDYDYCINQIINQNGAFLVCANVFKPSGYNDLTLLIDRYDDLFFSLSNDGMNWSGSVASNSRQVGGGKHEIQVYSKNGKSYLSTGLPETNEIASTLFENFKETIESARKEKSDLLISELSIKGVTNVYSGSLNEKKSSELLLGDFLTINGGFLIPLTDFNNMTGASKSYKFDLLEVK